MPRRHGRYHRVVRAARRGCGRRRRGRAGPRALATLRLRSVCPARRAASRARTRRRQRRGRRRGDRPPQHRRCRRVVRATGRGCERRRGGRAGPRALATLRLRSVCPARRAASRARTRRRQRHGRRRGDRPPQHRRCRRVVRAAGRGCERRRHGRAGPRAQGFFGFGQPVLLGELDGELERRLRIAPLIDGTIRCHGISQVASPPPGTGRDLRSPNRTRAPIESRGARARHDTG